MTAARTRARLWKFTSEYLVHAYAHEASDSEGELRRSYAVAVRDVAQAIPLEPKGGTERLPRPDARLQEPERGSDVRLLTCRQVAAHDGTRADGKSVATPSSCVACTSAARL
jgi:hypothetical protein